MHGILCAAVAAAMLMFAGCGNGDPVEAGLPGEEIVDTGLVVNEFLASNDSVDMDGEGETDDWIELHNRGDAAIDLSIYSLADGELKQPYLLPDMELEAGGFLRVWIDNDPEQGFDHLGFKLSRKGESIWLRRESDGVLADFVQYEEQQTDISSGRLPDGSGEFVLCEAPSPGLSNADGCTP